MARQSLEERRQHFIDAAIQVLANEGVARATTRRIAEVAQVPLAGLHYCFKTKEELFEAVVESSTAGGIEWAGRGVEPGIGLQRAVEIILRAHLEWLVENRSLMQAQFELTHWALRNAAYQHLAHREIEAYVGTTVQLLREVRREHEAKIDLRLLAQHLIALVDGHALQLLSLENNSVDLAMDFSIRLVQAAINAEAPEPAALHASAGKV